MPDFSEPVCIVLTHIHRFHIFPPTQSKFASNRQQIFFTGPKRQAHSIALRRSFGRLGGSPITNSGRGFTPLILPACNDYQSKISSAAETIKLPVRNKFLIEFI